MSKLHFVYWIHLSDHTDITTQGYVGITSQGVEKRFKKHCSSAKSVNFLISRAINKYGAENLIVDTLCMCSAEYAKSIEKKLRPHNFIGWNMRVGGKSSPDMSPEQYKLAAEKRRKTMQGRFLKGREHPNWKHGLRSKYESTLEPLDVRLKRRAQKIADALRGRPLSEDAKFNISEAKKKYFEENGNWCNSQANLDMWLMAELVYDTWSESPCGDRALSRKLGVKRNKSIQNMIKLFKEGWVPSEDERYRRFINDRQNQS